MAISQIIFKRQNVQQGTMMTVDKSEHIISETCKNHIISYFYDYVWKYCFYVFLKLTFWWNIIDGFLMICIKNLFLITLYGFNIILNVLSKNANIEYTREMLKEYIWGLQWRTRFMNSLHNWKVIYHNKHKQSKHYQSMIWSMCKCIHKKRAMLSKVT